MGDNDRVDVRWREADSREVIKDLATVRAHGLAGSGFDQNAPAAGFDQQRVEVECHVIGRKKGLTQDLLKLGFRRIARIDARRATNHAVAQHCRADVPDAEAVMPALPATCDAAWALAVPEPPRFGRSMLDAPATADSMIARLLRVKAFIGLPFRIGHARLRYAGV